MQRIDGSENLLQVFKLFVIEFGLLFKQTFNLFLSDNASNHSL